MDEQEKQSKKYNVYYVHVTHWEPCASTMAIVAEDEEQVKELAHEMLKYHKDIEIIDIKLQEAPEMAQPDEIELPKRKLH